MFCDEFILKVWRRPIECLAKSWRKPGKIRTKAWRKTGESLAYAWRRTGESLTKAWRKPDESLTKAWRKPDESLAKAWQRPGKRRMKAWRKPGESLANDGRKPGESLANDGRKPGESLANDGLNPGKSRRKLLCLNLVSPWSCLFVVWICSRRLFPPLSPSVSVVVPLSVSVFLLSRAQVRIDTTSATVTGVEDVSGAWQVRACVLMCVPFGASRLPGQGTQNTLPAPSSRIHCSFSDSTGEAGGACDSGSVLWCVLRS